MTVVSLPEIFRQYEPLVKNIRRVSSVEYSSTCPTCGGDDRCHWFLRGNPCGWCRVNGHLFFPDQAPNYVPPSPEQLAKWTQERIAEQEARKRSAERALEHLRSARIWEQYHDQMDKDAISYWERRGIPKHFVDVFRFGWCPEFRFTHDDDLFVRPTATIPFFDSEGKALQIKHRILWEDSAPEELKKDKYRPEIKGVSTPLFLCDPTAPLTGEVTVVEGEIKAAVAHVTLDSAKETVVGLPGINPDEERLDILKDAERILLVTDPGTRVQTWKLCKILGPKRCRVLIPTRGKLDDLILESNMTGNELRGLFRQAVPAA